MFRSHRTYQKRHLFFELEQLLKVFFPAIFVRPPRPGPPTTAGTTRFTVLGSLASYNDITDTAQLFRFVCLRRVGVSLSFPPPLESQVLFLRTQCFTFRISDKNHFKPIQPIPDKKRWLLN